VNVAMATGLSEGDGRRQANLVLMSAVTFAVLGGFFWGWLTDRWGPRRTLNIVLRSWMGVFVLAAGVGILGLPLQALYAVAAWAGLSLGGVWASDRPYMLRLTPPGRVGEFYGLYGMVSRFSAIVGPVIWAGATGITMQVLDLAPAVGQGISVLTLLTLVVASYAILQPVRDEPRTWTGKDALPARAPHA